MNDESKTMKRLVRRRRESTRGIPKFLPPMQTEWRELAPEPLEGEENANENKRRASEAQDAREALKEALLTSLQMPHLLVLAGSGTSLGDDIGGPSMYNLWDYAVNANPPTDGGVETEITDAAKRVIKKVGYDLENDRANIELLLSRCEAYLEVKMDRQVIKFVNDAKEVILEQCTDFLFDDDTDEWEDEKLEGHCIFLHRLSRRRVRDPRLKIFTTNYDLCFERAASLNNLIIVDGFSFSQPRYFSPSFFEYDIVRRSVSTSEVGDPLEGVFHLLKLHGSVNWERGEDGIIHEEWEPDAGKACLIYPAAGKYQQSYIQPHLELIAQYLSALRQPNTCLLIAGFGFNDDHLAEPILAAIKNNPHLRTIIADFQAEDFWAGSVVNASKYWLQLKKLALKGENIWFVNASFKDFAYLLPDLKALTPAQQLEKAIRRIGD